MSDFAPTLRLTGILSRMDINDYPPNKPNFGLIVALAGATILVVFVLAYFFVRIDGNHLTFKHHSPEPHSQLILPNARKTLSS